ncbi:MAG: hypothetical protein P8X89_21340 [Reinekea sp.]
MLPKNFNEPMGAPAIFEKQIEIMESRIQDRPTVSPSLSWPDVSILNPESVTP